MMLSHGSDNHDVDFSLFTAKLAQINLQVNLNRLFPEGHGLRVPELFTPSYVSGTGRSKLLITGIVWMEP